MKTRLSVEELGSLILPAPLVWQDAAGVVFVRGTRGRDFIAVAELQDGSVRVDAAGRGGFAGGNFDGVTGVVAVGRRGQDALFASTSLPVYAIGCEQMLLARHIDFSEADPPEGDGDVIEF